jgi:hypothetical protein
MLVLQIACMPGSRAQTFPVSGPSGRFSPTRRIAVGLYPEYPSELVGSGASATVTADCVIERDASITHCLIIKNTGLPALGNAMLNWLKGANAPRYLPAIRDGVPQREEHQWVVTFRPGAPVAVPIS